MTVTTMRFDRANVFGLTRVGERLLNGLAREPYHAATPVVNDLMTQTIVISASDPMVTCRRQCIGNPNAHNSRFRSDDFILMPGSG